MVTAYLLYNGSATYFHGKLKPYRGGVGKPSLNRAISRMGVDPKPGDLSMARVKRG